MSGLGHAGLTPRASPGLRKQLAKGRIKLLRAEFLDLITEEFATLIGA